MTVKDHFPIPTVDDMLDKLYRVANFTQLDLSVIQIPPPDILKTAFCTHNGRYEILGHASLVMQCPIYL